MGPSYFFTGMAKFVSQRNPSITFNQTHFLPATLAFSQFYRGHQHGEENKWSNKSKKIIVRKIKWEKRKSDLNKRMESHVGITYVSLVYFYLCGNQIAEGIRNSYFNLRRGEIAEHICSAVNLVLLASFQFP